jgi:hypothetical protein
MKSMASNTKAKNFTIAFKKAWDKNESLRHDADGNALVDFGESSQRTEYMLGRKGDASNNGVLPDAVDFYGDHVKSLIPKREWSKFDLVGVTEMKSLPTATNKEYLEKDKQPYWMKVLQVVIEHENADDVETEMWKMIHLRSPLKVLVFYDVSQQWQETSEFYQDKCFESRTVKSAHWLDTKIKLLASMIAGANELLPLEGSEYLLIIGKRSKKNIITWRTCEYLTNPSGQGFSEPIAIDLSGQNISDALIS